MSKDDFNTHLDDETFKRIAKRYLKAAQKNPSELTLMSVQENLARALGFQNLHQAQAQFKTNKAAPGVVGLEHGLGPSFGPGYGLPPTDESGYDLQKPWLKDVAASFEAGKRRREEDLQALGLPTYAGDSNDANQASSDGKREIVFQMQPTGEGVPTWRVPGSESIEELLKDPEHTQTLRSLQLFVAHEAVRIGGTRQTIKLEDLFEAASDNFHSLFGIRTAADRLSMGQAQIKRNDTLLRHAIEIFWERDTVEEEYSGQYGNGRLLKHRAITDAMLYEMNQQEANEEMRALRAGLKKIEQYSDEDMGVGHFGSQRIKSSLWNLMHVKHSPHNPPFPSSLKARIEGHILDTLGFSHFDDALQRMASSDPRNIRGHAFKPEAIRSILEIINPDAMAAANTVKLEDDDQRHQDDETLPPSSKRVLRPR